MTITPDALLKAIVENNNIGFRQVKFYNFHIWVMLYHFLQSLITCSFVLLQKNQKNKTKNSFHAKATATNLLHDPSRPPAGGLPDRSVCSHTQSIALFCNEKNLRSKRKFSLLY